MTRIESRRRAGGSGLRVLRGHRGHQNDPGSRGPWPSSRAPPRCTRSSAPIPARCLAASPLRLCGEREMNFQPLDLAAPGIAGLRPYVPGKPISELERELGITGSIKLASNENPLGRAEALAAAEAALGELARYPDGGASSCGRARRQARRRTATASPWQRLERRARHDRAGVPPPLRRDRDVGARLRRLPDQLAGGRATVRIAPAKDHGHDLDAMRERVGEHTRVVWVANPNNPTGRG